MDHVAKEYSSCTVEGVCTKKFPKAFQTKTTLDENGYIAYRKRDNDK